MSLYRKRRPVHAIVPRVTLTPLIDTVLVLLVIFIVTIPVIQHALNIDIPSSESSDKQTGSKELMIGIDAHKQLHLNGTPVTIGVLVKMLQEQRNLAENVFIYADKSLKYETVIATIDQLKTKGGVKNVILATQRVDSRSNA